jgi:hypothetical protein
VPSVARKITKRRKPFEGIFGFSPTAPRPDTASVAPSTHTVTNKLFKRQSIFKSASTSSIPQTISNASVVPSEKRQKRGSVLGRFARRFSIVRRVAGGHSRGTSLDSSNEWSRGDRQSMQVTDRASTVTRPASVSNQMSPSEKRQSTRILPPQPDTTPSLDSPPLETPTEEGTQDREPTQEGKRDSISSLEVSYSIGRLTVVNPDVPDSTDSSPTNQTHPLPASRFGPVPTQSTMEKALTLSVPLSAIVFPDTHPVDSPLTLTPPVNGPGSTTPTSVQTPVSRAPSGEDGQRPWPNSSNPPSSQPISISRTVLKGGPRASRPSPPSSAPASAPPSLPPPAHPMMHPISRSAPPAIETDSPLSRASIIANPPTPYAEPTPINSPPSTALPDVPPVIQVVIPSPVVTPIVYSSPHSSSPHAAPPHEPRKHPSRESSLTKNQGSRQPKPSGAVRSRETETFHLVRSPSAGPTQPTGESIIVGGQQWEVVGGSAQRSRKKEKDDSRWSHTDPERHESKRPDRTVEKVMLLSSPV